jgi:hypothetical protein
MPNLPPLHLVVEVLQFAVLPAALAAAAVFAVILLAGGNRWATPGAALALAAGLAIGNWYRSALPWLPEGLPWNAEVPKWHWLLWLGLAALAVGVLIRLPQVPAVIRWLIMAAAAGFVAWLFVPPDLLPEDLREKAPWGPAAAFAAVVFIEWALLEHLCERSPGGGIPLGLALTFLAGAAVLIHAGSLRFTDVATILSASLSGIAVAARQQADAGAVAPGVAVLLPGLLLTGQNTMASEVPVPLAGFLLVGLAPLALLLTLLPPFRRWEGIRLNILQLILILVPVIVAVALAMQTGPLEFE